MEIYQQKNIRNIALVIIGIFILMITMIYANYLAKQLSQREELMERYYEDATNWKLKNKDFDADATLAESITMGYELPIISEQDGHYIGNNWGEEKDTSQAFLSHRVEEFIRSGKEPLVGEGLSAVHTIYLFKSRLHQLIRLFPFVQFILIGLFVGFGYYIFNTARRAEQNRVWAGMAKETAHQLGTPISAILAWIEYLKESNTNRPEQLEVIDELRSDVNRLELIADRFSKIGSAPDLQSLNVYQILDDIKIYMQKRASRHVHFEFPDATQEQIVRVNEHLFSWVLENLIRNSLDAMDGTGTISATVSQESDWVHIDITDSGKGILPSMHKEIFKPGITTKKRGWGLGLSLAKRIIDQYHNGKIYVKRSRPEEGTTITIQLPAV